MAADTGHLVEIYSRMAKAHLLPRLNAIGLTNRSYEGDARGASEVKITTDVRPSGTVGDIGRDGAWPNAVEVGTVQDTLQIDQDPASSVRVPWLDNNDVPVAMVGRAAYWNQRRLAEYVDADVYNVMLNGTVAGNKTTVGTATVYVGADGKGVGTDADKLIADYLRDLDVTLQNNYLRDTGIAQYRWRVDMSPALARSLETYLLEEHDITRESKESIVTMTGIDNENFRFSVWGFDIFVTTQIPTVEISSKTHAQIIVCNPMATTMAMHMPLVQAITPEMNQLSGDDGKPGWVFRERFHYGRKVIDDRFIYTAQVRQEA